MKNKVLLYCALLLLLSTSLCAQELKVESFAKLERDLLARTAERLDRNDVPCAVLRISVPDAKSFSFSGNIIGEVVYHPGEAIVYLTDRTRKIKVSSDKFGVLDYEFPERLVKSVTYRLTLKPIDNKTRTLVMPIVGVGETLSYGFMIGVVKKTGAYLKVKHNLKKLSADMECGDDGRLVGTDNYPWFSGATKSTRFAITGGVIQRIMKPLYFYVGAGYGSCKLGWETVDGQWAENTKHSYSGIEADLGCVYRLNNIALSVGYQTNGFKYHEATIGLGIMF